ncbi:MAG: Gfo/Idh/MocA family oxidoreductase [Clostridiales bacterium]|nr:Gfo/Idh/MocA family oxidoreductase [Clostridiales bacterium]MCF8022785.1 Gfo/Idh/MocA family oxidoreductase [Clostridiales bacterium]
MSAIRFGIVGCGHISKKHVSAIQQLEDADLVAVCDSDLDRANSFVEQNNIAVYSDYDEFIHDNKIDAVIICTPSGLHASMGEKAALGGKHLLIEKPFVLDLKDGNKLVEVCKQQGVKLGVVHPNRMKPAVQALHRAIKDNWFGKITHVNATLRWNRNSNYFKSAAWRGTREYDGGILLNQAIHNIDLLNWLVGPVEEVFAYGTTRLRDIEVEDVCVSSLRLQNEALGIIESAITLYPENLEETLSIFGSEGTAVLGGKTLSRIQEWKFSCLSENDALKQVEEINSRKINVGHNEIVRDFVSAVLNERDPLVSGEEALKTIQLILSIYNSIDNHVPVKVKEMCM